MPGADFGAVFDRLRAIMAPHTAGMVVVRDLPGDHHVDTGLTRADGYSFAFGAVQVKAPAGRRRRLRRAGQAARRQASARAW